MLATKQRIATAISACLVMLTLVTGEPVLHNLDDVFVMCERFVDEAYDMTNCTVTAQIDTLADSWLAFGLSNSGDDSAMVISRFRFR